MYFKVTFSDFSSEKKYLLLQNKFASYCEKNPDDYVNYPFFNEVTTDEFYILEKTVNPSSMMENYKKIWFVKDFLLPSIEQLSERVISFFQNKFDEIYFEEKKMIAFSEYQLKKIFDYIRKNGNAYYLNDDIKNKLLNQSNLLVKYLKDDILIHSYKFEDKIKWNINKTDIFVLFILLRESKKIHYYTNSELRFLIEKNFQYYRSNESKYKEIKAKPSTIGDILNGHISINRSLNRLKELFTNEDFYHLK